MTLTTTPPLFTETRNSLHRVARYVVTPRRQKVDGRERLIQLPGGFGTPVLGDDTQMRIEGTELVFVDGGTETREPITSLRQVGDLVGIAPSDHTAKPDIPQMGDIDEQLNLDDESARFLARWYQFGSAVLGQLREDEESLNATEIVIWSHHLDPSIELFADAQTASLGASAGDGAIDEPYLYITPWSTEGLSPGDYWNAESFFGSAVTISQLVASGDPLGTAIAFFRTGRELLAQR